MTKRPKNYEPPLHLDMDFEEALERFAGTDKKEADQAAAKSKKKKVGKGKDPPDKLIDRNDESD